MDMRQIVFYWLLFLSASASKFPCYDEEELWEKADKKLKSHYPQPPEPEGLSGSEAKLPVCPVELYQQSAPISSRSLSPWRYIRETEEDRFPPTIAVAQCLCEGCIITTKDKPREESADYNSVLIKQSRVVLRKKRCEDGKKYRLVPENVSVAVGCTCVKAKTVG